MSDRSYYELFNDQSWGTNMVEGKKRVFNQMGAVWSNTSSGRKGGCWRHRCTVSRYVLSPIVQAPISPLVGMASMRA